jgi:hexokinase
MARAYQSGTALVGAIFGTGTNAAYVERLSAVTKLSGHQSPTFKKAEKMIINTEWGAFDNSVRLASAVFSFFSWMGRLTCLVNIRETYCQ